MRTPRSTAQEGGPGTVCFFEEADDRSSRDTQSAAIGPRRRHRARRACSWSSSRSSTSMRTGSRLRGSAALAASLGAGWCRRANSSRRRGDRADPRDRRMGDPARLCDAGGLAGRDKVAVNFSAAQFRNNDLLQIIVQALADARIARTGSRSRSRNRCCCRNRIGASGPRCAAAARRHRGAGHFGTGFSSLTYLRKLPFSRSRSTSPSSATCWCSRTAPRS